MKHTIAIIILFLLLVNSTALSETLNSSLTQLTTAELRLIYSDIDEAQQTYHTPTSDNKTSAFNAAKEVVELYFKDAGLNISWAWFDYTYTKNWDLLTISTHINYKDSDDNSYSPKVYAEIFPENDEWSIFYLTIGENEIINRRQELPTNLWTKTPTPIINTSTGIDLSIMTETELAELHNQVHNELSAYHDPDESISNLLLSMTKVVIEDYFRKQGFETSWAWFDYEYVREWDFYALTTPIVYKNDNEKNKAIVYAEAYPENHQYSLCYVKVDETVLIDNRNRLPKNLYELTEDSQFTLPPFTSNAPEPLSTPLSKKPEISKEPTNHPLNFSDKVITIDNCPEFNQILKSKDEFAPCIKDFAKKHSQETVEFDGNIAYISTHENYKTRYDILLFAGDYDTDHQAGPAFQFKDVNIYDMGSSELFLSDFIKVGDNVHIVAKIKEFDDKSGLFFLDPISVELRTTPFHQLESYQTLSPGCTGQEVLNARQRLYELGYFRKKPTQTEYTNNMMDYVKKFEEDYGLSQDGILSPEDQVVLFSN